MKLMSGLFSFLLACLAVILYGLGDLERTAAFVEKSVDHENDEEFHFPFSI